MPPKKGAKDAPQVEPGTCRITGVLLACILRSSLHVPISLTDVPKDPNALDYQPRTVALKVVITTALEAQGAPLKQPSFRYTFFNGRRETTPELGDIKAGWKEVDLGGGRKALQWERGYESQPADKNFALAINAQPVLMFTLQDKMDGELATALRPGDGGASANPASAPAAGQAAAPPAKGKTATGTTLTSASGAALPTLPGRNFISSVVLDCGEMLTRHFAGAVARVHDSADASTAPPPEGLSYLRLELVTDKPGQPLLSSGLLHDLNPLVVRIRDIKGLPGLRLDCVTQKKYMEVRCVCPGVAMYASIHAG